MFNKMKQFTIWNTLDITNYTISFILDFSLYPNNARITELPSVDVSQLNAIQFPFVFQNLILGKVLYWYKYICLNNNYFLVRINITEDPNNEHEFSALGGKKHTYIPYKDTVPVVGGISRESIYQKVVERQTGFTRVFDEDGTFVGIISSGLKKEIETLVSLRVNKIINKMNLVKRDEFDVLKKMVQKMIIENEKHKKTRKKPLVRKKKTIKTKKKSKN